MAVDAAKRSRPMQAVAWMLLTVQLQRLEKARKMKSLKQYQIDKAEAYKDFTNTTKPAYNE